MANRFRASVPITDDWEHFEFAVAARYADQNWELDLPVRGDLDGPEDVAQLRDQFDSLHQELFAVCDRIHILYLGRSVATVDSRTTTPYIQ